MRSRLAAVALVLLGALLPRVAGAQDEANVQILARLLAAEDARHFDPTLFQSALLQSDSSVRRQAALALGRLRDPRGAPLLRPLLIDSDSLVQTTAIFALGLLGDTGQVPVLTARASDGTPLSDPAALELITAVARLGGGQAAAFVRQVLDASVFSGRDDLPYLQRRAALEAWRLGAAAPVDQLMGLLASPLEDTRYAAIFSLGRIRARAAGPRIIDALSDRTTPLVRAVAARTLTRAYADSAGLDPATVVDLLLRAANDDDAGVRALAVGSLVTFHQARAAAKLLPLLDDPAPNVQVRAAETLGRLGDPGVVPEFERLLDGGKGTWARRRALLLGLARLDSTAFLERVGGWERSGDWRLRAAAAEGWAIQRPAAVARFLGDRDPRVVGQALQAWGDAVDGADTGFVAACRARLGDRDAAVRAIAAAGVARAADPGDIAGLVAGYRLAAHDSFPDAALADLDALMAIGQRSAAARERVNGEALAALPAPGRQDYVIRRWAEQNWPIAAATWGPARPIQTGRTMEDYRGIARQFLVGFGPERYPHVKVEVDGLGTVELELYGPEAPLTVANFLRLVDRRYFDGQRFHRVVPAFVVQAGDPRGDGWGGPGGAIRDEINRRRYQAYVLGMALSGPDTGGSQWFITLSPQPHLDGTYTVFGEVADGVPVLLRITQGDLIRSIHR